MDQFISAINNYVQNEDSDDIEVIIGAFRYLRNACAKDPESQNVIVRHADVMESTKNILINLVMSENLSKTQMLCLVVGLQFLANLLVNNKKNQKHIWLSCRELLDKCLTFNNEKVQHCCLMILYNIFLSNEDILTNISEPFETIISLTAKKNNSEYALFTTDLFINNPNYLAKFYETLSTECKLIILEEMERLAREPNTSGICLSSASIQFMTRLFSQKADIILNKMNEKTVSFNVVEVIKLLNIFAACSSNDEENSLGVLQSETSFFINCVTILKAVHILSKEKNNYFTAETKISEFLVSEENTINNPFIGFKCDLIRIIGNLCWKNGKFKDIVRDLECIQVILDCCIIDRKNPFIAQWSILAIHNICEDNADNQKIIAQLTKRGVIDAKNLKDLGIVLNKNSSDGNTLYMAPLNIQER